MVKLLIYTLFSGTQDTPNLKLNTKPDSRDAKPMIRLCDSLTTFHFMHEWQELTVIPAVVLNTCNDYDIVSNLI